MAPVSDEPATGDDVDTTHDASRKADRAGERSSGGAPSARRAADLDVTAMGAMLGRSFADDPLWEWMCRGRMRHFTRLATPFFAVEIRRHISQGGAWTVAGCDAAGLWNPPNRWRTGFGDIARWAPSASRLFGLHLPRSLRALSVLDKVHPSEPHWYLATLGTDPDHQGRGLGSAVMQPVLDECDATGTPAYLESSKEANVGFYERHGFMLTDRITVGSDGPPMWLMWRDPRPPEA